jgi:hypothetical protein
LAEFAQNDLGKMARRAWNRFEPTWSPWWLVPSPKQPHHEHGKYYFDWGNPERTELLAGFYTEKGLDPAVAIVYPSKKGKQLIMTPKWNWHHFAEGVASESLKIAMEKVAAEHSIMPELHISGGYVQDPSFYNPYEKKLENDCYMFSWNPLEDQFSLKTAKRPAMVLKALNHVKKYADLIRVLEEYNQDQFLWLDVFVCFRLTVATDPIQEDGTLWSEEEIWQKALHSFSPWIT